MGALSDRLKKDSENLSTAEKLELVEYIVHSINTEKGSIKRRSWDSLYGIGKDVWDKDAQDYISSIRQER